ncbi:MAG: tRNA (N(6)-L-threonylcarbamoyladenosine(37)-C(2))-methylthiotransferase MtaB [Bacteroidales bacterium]|jgi:threonylcarbamoyladenosine tRNA methylthiotransferase MtaB|nr:tRNA (N(6)-L-threonylcarbamoyladenosine(37)-C(2))-methylthiotransferase MtaB [Bacteroidales bacterium]
MMKIALLTLGCKLNFAETATYERGFLAAGLEVVPWSEAADVYLVNTCSVTGTSDSKSRNLIRKVHRINPAAHIVVTGCSAELRRAEIERIEGVSRVFGAAEKGLVVRETLRLLGLSAEQSDTSSSMPDRVSDYPAIPLEGVQGVKAFGNIPRMFPAYSAAESRTRAFLKVQDGCNNYCKYCTVPYARGESRNLPIADCVHNAERIAAEGVREIVLTGVNTGDFGRTTGESFLDLLKALEGVDGIERYRISSIEPNLLKEETVDWIAGGTKFQPHFHIPLQTGSDELLARMGRRYDTAFFADRISMIRSKMERPGAPKVFFGIDVMVGLPGETDALFRQSFDFIERIRPAFIHVFPYSRRPGTPAASMPGQVDESTKKHRVGVLETLCRRLHEDFRAQNRGIRERVLFESTVHNGRMEGYTGNYIRICRPYDPALVNTLVDIVID